MMTAAGVLVEATFEVNGQGGARRSIRLREDESLSIGRFRVPSKPHHLGVDPRWMGVSRDSQVSARLLDLRFSRTTSTGAVITWRTDSSMWPHRIRITRDLPAIDPTTAGSSPPNSEGSLRLSVRGTGDIYICQISSRTNAFEWRMRVRLCLVQGQHEAPTVTEGVSEDAAIVELLIADWWNGRRTPSPGQLTWRTCLAVTVRMAERVPPGSLAEEVSRALQQNYEGCDAQSVRNHWRRAIKALVSAESAVKYLPALGIASLSRYQQGQVTRLPSSEVDMRQLSAYLRSTRSEEWS